MKLSEICIRRPVFAIMLNLALILFGIIALTRLPVRELPNIDPPIISVSTVLDGASAEVMESEVTQPLEEEISSIPGIRTLTSTNREQVSNITVEFNLNENVDVAAQDVRDRVSRARGRLPDDVDEPIIAKQEADANPILWTAFFSDRLDTEQLTRFAENVVKERLQTIPGVSSIMIAGGKRFAIRIRLDSKKMAARGVTVQDVDDVLRRENVELPSGNIEGLNRELAVQMRAEMKTPEQFNNLIIRYDNGMPVRLQDIGIAEPGVEDERTIARYLSKPAIGVGVVRQSNANTITVANAIKEEIRKMEAVLPAGVEYAFAYDESTFVKHSVREVAETIIIAFILVVAVVFLFLRDVRSTIIPSIAIPVSVVGVFAVLLAFGFSINILTLLALVLAIGLVVDDAIIVLENIYRHIENGLPATEAAFKGMKEIGFAVIATTLSLVAVFVPLAFQTGTAGRLFSEFALALAGAVIISSFVALTLSPMMCARLLKPPTAHGRLYNSLESLFRVLEQNYSKSLAWAMNHKSMVLGGGAASVLLGMLAFWGLKQDFLPEEDKSRVFCVVMAPQGSTAEYTDEYMKQLEQIIAEQPEVAGYFSAVAMARGTPGRTNQGMIFVRLKERADRDRSVQAIVRAANGLQARFFREAEGVFAIPIIPSAISRGSSQSLQLVIQARDLDNLNDYTQDLLGKIQYAGILANPRASFELTKPEVDVQVNRDRANAMGVNTREIARVLQVLLGGTKLSDFKMDGKLYEVIAQLERANRLTPSSLDSLYVRGRDGRLVQFSNLVQYSESAGPNQIDHYNRIRSATVEGTPIGRPLGQAMAEIEAIVETTLPPGFTYEWAGQSRELRETGQSTLFVFALAIIVVYMVLASQFESLIHPFTVMLALPLSAIGAFGLLWLCSFLGNFIPYIFDGMTLNLYSQVGLVLLVGLVTKNSILLVTFANQLVEEGKNAVDAMLEAGAVRLRPILMTAVSTIIGILPIAIGLGAGAESRRPLGVIVIGGMLTSTFLTLYVIPIVYVYFDRSKTAQLATTLPRVKIPSPLTASAKTLAVSKFHSINQWIERLGRRSK